MAKANFTVDTIPGFVLLEDLGTGMSITNDAEQVVRWLAETGVLDDGRRVLYRDSLGKWDELMHKDGRFAGFAPLGAKGQKEAVRIARERGECHKALDREAVAHARDERAGEGRSPARGHDRGRER
jgi:hypothetical protein